MQNDFLPNTRNNTQKTEYKINDNSKITFKRNIKSFFRVMKFRAKSPKKNSVNTYKKNNSQPASFHVANVLLFHGLLGFSIKIKLQRLALTSKTATFVEVLRFVPL